MDLLLTLSLIVFVIILALAALSAVYTDPEEIDQEERRIVARRESKRWQQSHQN
jgi:hypothetical protein